MRRKPSGGKRPGATGNPRARGFQTRPHHLEVYSQLLDVTCLFFPVDFGKGAQAWERPRDLDEWNYFRSEGQKALTITARPVSEATQRASERARRFRPKN